VARLVEFRHAEIQDQRIHMVRFAELDDLLSIRGLARAMPRLSSSMARRNPFRKTMVASD
jgi:hypothetical protein